MIAQQLHLMGTKDTARWGWEPQGDHAKRTYRFTWCWKCGRQVKALITPRGWMVDEEGHKWKAG